VANFPFVSIQMVWKYIFGILEIPPQKKVVLVIFS